MLSQGFWSSLKLGRRLLTAARLIYELSSVVVKPIKRLLTKKEEEKTLLSIETEKPISESRILSTPLLILDYLDKVYLPLYYGTTIVTASSFYYSAYRLLGPTLNTYALACLKMAAAHPYSIGLSLILLSDFPIVLVGRGIFLVLTKTGQWALRRIAPSK